MSSIRNIGIFAHIDSGKTTFVERILFETGAISSPGNVIEGTTEMDSLPEEIIRGISITASSIHVEYKKGKKIEVLNIIDTPGHLDFHTQVDSSLLAVDIAVLLIDITVGIRSQTEMIIEKLKKAEIPIFIFINKIDKNRETYFIIEEISEYFPIKLCPLFYFKNESIEYVFESKEILEDLELPLIDWEEELVEKYFENKNKKRIILQGMSRGASQKKFIPVLAGSALTGEGVASFLEFLFLTEEIPKKKKTGSIVYKRQFHPELGKVVYLKNYTSLKQGDKLYSRDRIVVLEKIFQNIAGGVLEAEELEENSFLILQNDFLELGEVLHSTPKKNEKEKIQNRKGLFSILLEPNKADDKDALINGLDKLIWEDPGLFFQEKMETGQLELWGMGELHLEISANRLQGFVGDKFQIKPIRVAKYSIFKNMVKKIVFEHSTFDGKWKSGKIHGFLEARTDFDNKVEFTCDLPLILKEAIQAGFQEILSHGLDGNLVLGLNLKIDDYEEPEVVGEFSLALTKIAIIGGLKSVLSSHFNFIGPIGVFEALVPESSVGDVLSLLRKRHAQINSLDVVAGNLTRIQGNAPAESLLGFASVFRNLTHGKGELSLETHFSPKFFSEILEGQKKEL
ncbi:MAG: GTP-binding protein [Leptospiraceae bacterium]|nr:GTP-binding protein [Leptospiraceae bacterium]